MTKQTGWFLALCGLLDAAYSLTSFFMQRLDGGLALRTGVHYRSTFVQMGVLALVAGIWAVAAGLWNPERRTSWLLAVNGLASSALGLLLTFWTGRIAFRTVALLIVVMAMSLGLYALATALTSRRRPTGAWLLGIAGAVSIGFALSFLVFALGWIKLDPSSPTLSWIGSYFALSAVCMLGRALRLLGRSNSGQLQGLPVLGNPKHAH